MENKIKKLNIEEKVLAFIIAFLAILSCSPVVFFGFNSILILLFSGAYFLLLSKFFVQGKVFLRREYLGVFFISITLFLYIAIPFRVYDRFSPSVIWFFLFSTVLLLNKSLLKKSFFYFSNIIYYICIASLIVLVLNAIGVSLPSKIIPREIGGEFTSYYISVRLSGQNYSVFGANLYRLNGIFAEPGHFGLLLSMVLFAYNGILKTVKGKIILLTCLLTLSFGTFILLFGLLAKNIVLERKTYLAFLIAVVLVFSLIFIPTEVLERFFFDKADGTLEERTSNYFINFYNLFLQSGDVLLGNGRDVLEVYGIRNSDYRGFLIRYGYFGILLYLLLMLSIYWKKVRTVQFLGFFYFLVVFLHRSWFVDYFAFLFFLIVLTYNLSYEESEEHR